MQKISEFFKKNLLSMIQIFFALAILVGLLTYIPGQSAHVVQAQEEKPVVVYMFWGDGCPHCAVAKPFFEEMAKKYPQVQLKFYEVWYIPENQQKFQTMATAYGFEPSGVPTIFIGDKYWEGYIEDMEPMFEEEIKRCVAFGCIDAGAGIIEPLAENATPNPTPNAPTEPSQASNDQKTIKLPFIGEVSLEHQSLMVSTLLIAFVDGVNPCSIWVLTMLLALTLHTGSRKRVLIIGFVFIAITALVYALFIAGLFTFLTVVSFMTWIQVVVAIVALVFALINIKYYFWYKEGVSLTIADDKKPGIFKKMRKVLDSSESIWGMIGATIVLAAGVSLVEFSCTAGFPVLWTNMLSAQNVTGTNFILLLILYMFIYQLDELIIFLTAVFTLKATRLEEKHGRILKLIGGVLMFTLAIIMIVKPSLLNELGSALIIFGVAFALTALVLLLHRRILPKMGIYIGSEMDAKNKHNKGKVKNNKK
jgi:cytochrome c biogenesis protein CcdA/thiol-disulfide isomerase/thioredoxin